MTSTETIKSSHSKFAWIAVVLVALAGFLLWLVPISLYSAREWVYPLIAAPLIGYALFVAVKARNWWLFAAAILALLSPAISLLIGFAVFGF
ncbi:hypothetical protein N24_0660 [Corynebacterium suranareeae]|uniref:Uncharacterized protein n=1 Tax=Corynebacterium suranareeae TaxID=2506452 RepID=A0A161J810_9CORY|nr:hypothetical protein [Corynebacterium suranareeae]BAU94922.1 hypothetical protein N24_0660 [Corynebacterium suranareeae]